MNALTKRILSACVAVLALILTVYYLKETGLFIFCYLAIGIGSYEMSKLLFLKDYPPLSKTNFVFVCLVSAIYLFKLEQIASAHYVHMLVFTWIVLLGIIFHKKFDRIELIQTYISKFFMGYIYVCCLPLMIVWLIQMNNGMTWFFTLLAVIFSGDIGAFIFGSLWGKTKIAPTLSPKKSLQGSIGGLLFSTVAALIMGHFFFAEAPMWIFVICGLLGGALGQIGDFFESLVKRIADVKDSGRIMPGHGGVLDRIDGVLFAGPLFYLIAYYVNNF